MSQGQKGKEELSSREVRVAVNFAQASMSALSQWVSPYNAFVKFGKASIGLLFFVLAGSVIAPAEGGIVLATYALLVVPTFIMGLVASFTSPLLKAAGFAVMRNSNYIVRPIYDYLVLLSIGLPWSLTWFWEGKVIGIAVVFLGRMNINYVGWAMAFLVLAFFIAGVLYSFSSRYTKVASQAYGSLVRLISGGSLVISIFGGAVISYIVFALISLVTGVNYGYLIYNVGLIGGFMLTIASLDLFKDLSPSVKYIPLTWNIVSMIIGVTGLMGSVFYVYAIIGVTIYLVALYVISHDGSWLWYALIAAPTAPAVAYYLGYVTKLLIDGWGVTIAYALSYIAGITFIVVVLITIFIIAFFVFYLGLQTHSLIGIIIAVLVAFAIGFLGLVFLSAVAGLVSFSSLIQTAYQYLVYPA